MQIDFLRQRKPPNTSGQMAPQVLYRVCYGSPMPSAFQVSLLTIRPITLVLPTQSAALRLSGNNPSTKLFRAWRICRGADRWGFVET